MLREKRQRTVSCIVSFQTHVSQPRSITREPAAGWGCNKRRQARYQLNVSSKLACRVRRATEGGFIAARSSYLCETRPAPSPATFRKGCRELDAAARGVCVRERYREAGARPLTLKCLTAAFSRARLSAVCPSGENKMNERAAVCP